MATGTDPGSRNTRRLPTLGQHNRLDRPQHVCGGKLRPLQLGHEYLTDVLEVKPGVPLAEDEARSALYALLESCTQLCVVVNLAIENEPDPI